MPCTGLAPASFLMFSLNLAARDGGHSPSDLNCIWHMTTSADPNDYLSPCDVIDAGHPTIVERASRLAADDPIETTRRCFKFVRDNVQHSFDHQRNPVTCRASDVLRERTGYCYAKSHLLAALLRANGIPAGLCYQRLAIDNQGISFCLHGLNAIYLPVHGWYRVDPRGNRDGIDAQFTPPLEQLAFECANHGEIDVPGIFVKPMHSVTHCLRTNQDWAEVASALPDVPSGYAAR